MSNAGLSRKKSESTHASAEVIDRAEALSRVDGDRELMTSLLDIFFSEARSMMEAVRTAVAKRDADKLEKAAHRLKGSVSIFGANTVSQTALELEKQGRGGDITKTAETAAQLSRRWQAYSQPSRNFIGSCTCRDDSCGLNPHTV